jgi:hypothetical protein
MGLWSASVVDLVDAFRRKTSVSVAASGPPADDDLRLFELENLGPML